MQRQLDGVLYLNGDVSKEWIPVASGTDLVPRHVFHGRFPGQELAIWRADDGFVNIWQNRCLHRGVRLTIGTNDGAQLRCQYHGWCYANRTGSCTYIPAHPGDSPAPTLTNRTFPSIEKYGLVWTTLADQPPLPAVEALENHVTVPLRAVSVNASMQTVCNQLQHGAKRFDEFGPANDSQIEVMSNGPMHVEVRQFADLPDVSLTFFIQPVDEDRSVIRGVLSGDQALAEPLPLLRFFSSALNEMRDHIESDGLTVSRDAEKISDCPGKITKPVKPGNNLRAPSTQTLKVRVSKKRQEAYGVVALELSPIKGMLPVAQPGAHIDIYFPGKHAAQYSLVNGPVETDRYLIGVKREEAGGGVSRHVHDELQQGDEVEISSPKNRFPLRRDAVNTVLIAGGIGITPILSMAKTLNHVNLDFALHYFVRSEGHTAFASEVSAFEQNANLHVGLSVEHTRDQVSQILEKCDPTTQIYVCGPPPMLDMVQRVSKEQGISEKMLHTEYFENPNTIDLGGAFRVVLSRSDKVLDIPQGKTILQVLQENDIAVPSSCEQGACGTCVVKVLSGNPIHQDVCLTEIEKQQGHWIATCVSRSSSDELILDI